MTDASPVRFKDFSVNPEPVTFRIAPDEFVCLPDIPFDALMELATIRTVVNDEDRKGQMQRMMQFFDFVLEIESAAILRRRMKIPTAEEPNPNPIGMRPLLQVMQWLTEVYGLRPTQPSSESVAGSDSESESSTDGASVEA